MTTDAFWDHIGDVHRASGGDMERKCVLLRERLSALDPEAIRSFHAHFRACDRRAFDWGLWGAAYLIHGGCGDDAFSDFRSTLISHGREVFEGALADPDSLADLPFGAEDACFEGYGYVVTDAIRALGGGGENDTEPFPVEPSGEP